MGTSMDEIPNFREFLYQYILPQPELDLEALQGDRVELENLHAVLAEAQTRAAALADKLVPYSLLGTAVTYALTRNATRAISILMVDFSCALKLSMPLAVLSAMRECGSYHITVKGGKYLEALANADTIVFDKTGTLTHATPPLCRSCRSAPAPRTRFYRSRPVWRSTTPTRWRTRRAGRCRKGHPPRRDAQRGAVRRRPRHCQPDRRREGVIGSQHFVFEDEGCCIPTSECGKFDALPPEYSHLYLAIGGVLAGVICIADPLREEAPRF